ncbi:SGNH/GDSL hydrolase family protein [Streptomyces noursei]|uniref:SGNH/GDSL hydrolase family protein n=1 Tax=Streptomyces noursei TaxID=1971 RepID=UPI00167B91B7|nr:SGNH/GDSL hydrolase family protein [Streptomyces noursei]MCZ1019914.1 SGNH/GDSL hydrolase family protein [Streptomyces noursei]GGX34336.1 lipase [Streptomyces noursei]
METNVRYNSFVAVGDSFTEGMSDTLPDGSYRGWADLLAARLAARAPGFRYANLAVRGKLIDQIADEQCGPAASMGADLVTLVGGLNDVLRPNCDVARVCARLGECADLLARGGGQLVLMRSPGRRGPVLERFRPRMEELFATIDELAGRHGAVVVDLYGSRALADPRLWAEDRLHLNAEGHRRAAEAVWQALGLPAEADWDAPLSAAVPPRWAARRAADVRFAREHLVPWIGRRLTGRSSGDGRTGAQFSAESGRAFWIGPADDANPGPVTGWRRAGA